MTASDWIAISSTIIAVFALVYSWRSNTKKFELSQQYRLNLLDWYTETTGLLIELRLLVKNDKLDDDRKIKLLSKLSTQIELGRFYFPNIQKGNSIGKHKPAAYQGYRHIALEFLVFSYNLFDHNADKKYLVHAEELQRQFTSCVFKLLQPEEFNKSIRKYTDISMKDGLTIETFLKDDPRNFIFYS